MGPECVVSIVRRVGHRVLLNACTSWWRRRRTEANHIARLRREEPSVAGPSPEALAFWAASVDCRSVTAR